MQNAHVSGRDGREASDRRPRQPTPHFVWWDRKLVVYLFSSVLGRRIGDRLKEVAAANGERFAFMSMERIEDTARHFDRAIFVRNPWDRTAALYRSVQDGLLERTRVLDNLGISADMTFADFLEAIAVDPMRSLATWPYASQLRRDPDFIGRYEIVSADWQAFTERYAIDGVERFFNPRPTGYRELYDDRTRDRVAEIYHQDVDRFGYAF